MRYTLRVLRYVRPYGRVAAASVVVTVLSALVGLLAPWPLKVIVDSVLGSHPLPPLLAGVAGPMADNRVAVLTFAVLAGFSITLADNGLGVLNSYLQTRLDQRLILDFRGDLLQHAQRLSLAYHDRQRSGQTLYAITYLANAAASLAMTVQPLAHSTLTLVGMFWISLRIDAQLALLSLTIVPFLYYSVGYYARHIQIRLREVKGMEGETLSIIHEAMSMLRVIVAFGRERHEYRRFRDQGEQALEARVKLTVRQTLFSLVVNSTIAAGTALVLWVGATHALSGRVTVGELLVVMAYIAAVYSPLRAISTTVGSLQDQLVSLQIAFELLDTEPQIRDVPGALALARPSGRVTFDRVWFNYDLRVDTLKDVSFEAEPGRVIAVVGPTGAGKTTLLSLIPRFYEATRGRILLDGFDIRNATLRSLREQISVVAQDPLLFSASIAENIRYGRLDATMGEVVAAAKAANAHDFIMTLPGKYDTLLGERGAHLSGGERQRIAVARAFLKNAPILILDEPTSSVDSKTEAAILDALERLAAGRTTFISAHRLSTIRNADVILVLNAGQLVERGTQAELLRQGGLYRQLYEAQMGRPAGAVEDLQPFAAPVADAVPRL